MRYVQKPPIVNAFEVVSRVDIPAWARPHVEAVYDSANGAMIHLVVQTPLGGSIRAYPGSWIVEKTPGELVPLAAETFHQNYDPMEEEDAPLPKQAKAKKG